VSLIFPFNQPAFPPLGLKKRKKPPRCYIAVSVIGLLLWSSKRDRSDTSPKTFTLRIPGKEIRQTFTMLTPAEVEARLRQNESSFSVARPNNPIYR
jgi:hypothetical protein